MHNINYDKFGKYIIKNIQKVEYENGIIKAVITTSYHGRITTKPYEFTLFEWAEIIERGYI